MALSVVAVSTVLLPLVMILVCVAFMAQRDIEEHDDRREAHTTLAQP